MDPQTIPDYRDDVITMLADSEATLRDRIVSLEADVATYRELAVAAFDGLRNLTLRLERVTAERDRLRDDNRRLREDALLRAGAEDEAA